MLNQLQLVNFKAFQRFTVRFAGRDAYLVGPNNAGKSTLIAGLRSAAEMLRIARRLNATATLDIDGRNPRGHFFNGDQVGLVTENLRHEFHQEPTALTLSFRDDAELHAYWPVDDNETNRGFFWVRHKDINLIRPREVSATFPSLGVVPVLSPVEHTEEALSEKYVRTNLDRRLASRHFRNQLALLLYEPSDTQASRFDEFLMFAQPWVPELELGPFHAPGHGSAEDLDFYYRERGSRIDKEIFWTGDGMQVWLQILLHVFRNQNQDVLVLDEPDVFLHADLQRRLVDLFDHVSAQTITATHSAEVLAEADPSTVVWVSADRRQATRAPKDALLQEMSDALGTHFNLRLARTLRSRCVVFVEGQDMRLLRLLAATVGANRLRQEHDVTVIALTGFDRWERVEPFAWMSQKLLKGTVTTYVILDRDYRDDDAVGSITAQLEQAKVKPHVWKWHEIENYLLIPTAIGRVAGIDEQTANALLSNAIESFEDDVYAQIQAFQVTKRRGAGLATATIAKEAKQRADAFWGSEEKRRQICPGKDVLGRLNQRLGDEGHRHVTARALAGSMFEHEIPAEVRRLLRNINEDAA